MVSHLMRGDWVEGERIPPERELCQRLGVGRASLREALKALEIMGMIETRLGEGTFVCSRSDFFARPLLWAITGSDVTDARELIEARKLIEVELAGLAAERATPDDLSRIGEKLDQMESALHDRDRFLEGDIGFHLAIAQAGHNRILFNAILLIRNLMQQWVHSALEQEDAAQKAFDQHKQIFIAIAQRNIPKARSAMEKHLDAMARYLAAPPPSDSAAQPAAEEA
jgi:GntR family transcriptional regulator, transcriptional repressor for pyruvate dehydrogenase complex